MTASPAHILPRHHLSITEIGGLEDRLYDHNRRATGRDDGQGLAFVAMDEHGIQIGAIAGYSWAGMARIKQLWVDEDHRGHGLGRRLLDAAIDEAIVRGCESVWTLSYTFQAPGLYEKCGFERVAELTGWPPGHANIVLRRQLKASASYTSRPIRWSLFDPKQPIRRLGKEPLSAASFFKPTRSDVRAMNGSAGANFLHALVALLVIIDPAGTAVLFAAMTRRDSLDNRARQARRACGIAFVVLSVFGVGGQRLLHALGIGLPAIKVAGGILLFLAAADMVTARGELRATRAEQQAGAQTEDISVFPLAIPLIAGPGSMTTMVLLQSDRYSDPLVIAVIESFGCGARDHPYRAGCSWLDHQAAGKDRRTCSRPRSRCASGGLRRPRSLWTECGNHCGPEPWAAGRGAGGLQGADKVRHPNFSF
jgi:MarC family membrane protein